MIFLTNLKNKERIDKYILREVVGFALFTFFFLIITPKMCLRGVTNVVSSLLVLSTGMYGEELSGTRAVFTRKPVAEVSVWDHKDAVNIMSVLCASGQ